MQETLRSGTQGIARGSPCIMTKSWKRAAICTRVSTSEQVRGTSLETQMEECHAYARSRSLEVVGEHVDGGFSGKYANRPGLDRLMRDCRAGLIDVVIVSKHDRFGRSFRHTVALIGELEDLDIEFVSIAERIDSTPSGRLHRNMLLSIAEFERERILERTVGGMEATARAGWWPAGSAPFGWRLVKGESGHTSLALEESEVAVWEQIGSCIIDRRMSTLETARELNSAGLRRRKGNVWSANSLWDLIRDTTCLAGTWTYRREGGRNGRKAMSGPPITMSIPPIFTPERYEALQAVAEARSWSRTQTKHPWLLSLRLFSPHGLRMHGMVDARGNRRYRCPGKIAADGGGGGKCGCYQIHADDVESQVWQVVAEALSKPRLLLALAEDQAQATAQVADFTETDLVRLDRKIGRLEKAAGEQLAKALAAGVDPAVAAVASSKLAAEIEATREQRNTFAAWVADAAERRSRVDMLAEIAEEASRALVSDGNTVGKQRVLDALAIRVTATGWTECDRCHGSGRLPGAKGRMCSECHGMRRRTQITIEGAIPVVEADEQAQPWPVKLAAS
jgi:DNA invertase Pin-like site-specific DNA recombinase